MSNVVKLYRVRTARKRAVLHAPPATADRVKELKWHRAGWIIPPMRCGDEIAEIVDSAWAEFWQAVDEDGIRVAPSLRRLLRHSCGRLKNIMAAEIRKISPMAGVRSGISATAAQLAITDSARPVFSNLVAAVACGFEHEHDSQCAVAMLLQIAEEDIRDNVFKFIGGWR